MPYDEVGQKVKDIPYECTYKWNLNKQANKKRRSHQPIHTENKQVVARGQGVGDGQNG